MTAAPPPLNYASPGVAPRKAWRSVFGWVLFILLAVMLFVLMQGKNRQNFARISFSEFDAMLKGGALSAVTIEGDEIYGTILPGRLPPSVAGGRVLSNFRTALPVGMSGNWSFMEYLLENRGRATVSVENNQNVLVQVLVPLIPWLLIFLFIWFFVFRQLRKGAIVQREPTPVIVVNQQQT